MGQVTAELWAGGAVEITSAVDLTLVWWWDRRVQTVRASGAGRTFTIQDANAYPCMPWGKDTLVVINPKDATNAFTLRDTPGSWSISVLVGRIVLVSRVKNNGSPQWWPWPKVLK